jgi:glycerol dehydrogenase-like iron-containing ADH family enzyme
LLYTSPQQNLFGLADVLSIHTALKDWQFAAEYNSEIIDKEVFEQASSLLNKVHAFILNSDVNEISHEVPKLFKFIGESGHITNIYGSGRPESGSEHIFARILEQRIDIPHGISVSLGILLMSILQGNFSKEIRECVKKLGTLKFIDEHNLTRELIEAVLTELRPREDRFSIIDREPIDAVQAREIVDAFISETGATFFRANRHALR